MSFRYDQPNGNRVVSDGKTLKVYEQENKQMFSQSVDKSYYPAALSFLMGEGKLTESFDLSLVPPDQLQFEGGYILDGKPKTEEKTPAYQRVLIWVDGATSQVRRVTVIDAQGNTNTFTFTAPRVNLPVAADEFKFDPPDGTTTISP
jgi:outer membrane lipoprotein carrier protein